MPAISMYHATVPVINQLLGGLIGVLDKAAAHCEAKKIEPTALLSARLFPDMFGLIKQVQIASDQAKGAAARLTGNEVPTYTDTEVSFADLKGRIQKTLDFVNSIPADKYAGSDDREIVLQMRAGPVNFKGLAYLQHFAMPNFYFHVATAYNILRHNGVEIGKRDFLGKYETQ